jgi:hypothetical protein
MKTFPRARWSSGVLNTPHCGCDTSRRGPHTKQRDNVVQVITIQNSNRRERAFPIPRDATAADVAWAVRELTERAGLDVRVDDLDPTASASVAAFRAAVESYAAEAADEPAAVEAAEGPAREIAQAVVPEQTGDADDELLRDQRAAAYFAALHTLVAGGTTAEAREAAAQAAAQPAASGRFTWEEDDITIR